MIDTVDTPTTPTPTADGGDDKAAAAAELHRAFVAQVAAERAAAKLTLQDLVERTGMPERSLVRYLTGERPMPVNVQIQLAEIFGISMSALWLRAEDRWRSQIGGTARDDG